MTSPVIEFSGCHMDEMVIRRGRLYYVDAYYDQGAKIQKDDDFLRWGKLALAGARRVLRRIDGEYFGAGALAWAKTKGHQFVR